MYFEQIDDISLEEYRKMEDFMKTPMVKLHHHDITKVPSSTKRTSNDSSCSADTPSGKQVISTSPNTGSPDQSNLLDNKE